MDQRAARTEESVVLLRELFGGGVVNHAGRFTSLPGVRLDPAPDTDVPIVSGGRQEAALRRAARLGDGWLGFLQTPETFRAARERIDQHRMELARSGAFAYSMLLSTYATASPEPATEAGQVLSKIYGLPPGPAQKYVVAGTPEKMVDRLHEYIEGGCQGFVLNPVGFGTERERQLAVLASEVLPALVAA